MDDQKSRKSCLKVIAFSNGLDENVSLTFCDF